MLTDTIFSVVLRMLPVITFPEICANNYSRVEEFYPQWEQRRRFAAQLAKEAHYQCPDIKKNTLSINAELVGFVCVARIEVTNAGDGD